MAGILELLSRFRRGEQSPGGGGGFLSRMANREPGQRPILDWRDRNRNAILGLAAGMAGMEPGAGWRYAMQGSQVDRQNRMEEEQRRSLTAALKAAQTGGLGPEMQQYLATNPAAAQQFLMSQLQQNPVETWEPAEVAGMQGQKSTRTGRFDPFPRDDPPTSYDEFSRARTDPAYAGFLESRRPQGTIVNVGPTGIDYGDPEAGTAWRRTPDGKVMLDEQGLPIAAPYQGGSIARETAETEAKVAGRQRSATQNTAATLRSVANARQILKDQGTLASGFVGSMTPAWLGGTPRKRLVSALSTINANAAFSALQEIRDNSPTGAALGPVSDFENRLLQSTITSLDPDQHFSDIDRNLEWLETIFKLNYSATTGEITPEEYRAKIEELGQIILSGGFVAPAVGGQPAGGEGDLYQRYGLEPPP